MNFWERRKYKKLVEALLHDAQHTRGMREDVADPADLDRMEGLEQKLRDALKARDAKGVDACAEELGQMRMKIAPPRKYPGWRENIEMFIVVLAVATGIRAYFISPFKIPTGSMQPTLNGITAVAQTERGLMDYFPLNIASFLLFGERYVEVRAPESGEINYVQGGEEFYTFANQGRTVQIPKAFFDESNRSTCVFFRYFGSDVVEKGQLLAAGRVRTGDMIMVDRVRYNFLPPKRGDVIVFRTKNVHHAGVRTTDHYIKRLVGLPGETIRIDPPYLVVNDKKVEQPFPFHRLLTDPRYVGYTLPVGSMLDTPADSIKVGSNEFLPFGDNTRSSLDGRYFGPVTRNDLLGPAFMVFWPFTGRWGLVR
ncbi:MAG: signal peptidase I [Verrucomicrobia bacterium]|nr:MAG: signal peptidase I [Verrucomicrobiota bacterium]